MDIPPRFVLDTDIGTDVDDVLSLAMLWGAGRPPELVTTVYGDTALRARLTQRYARLAGRDVRVRAGEPVPLSGREVWWAGTEGSLHDGLDGEAYESGAAVEAIVACAREARGALDVIAIGPLTDIAASILADPVFVASVRRLWIMGGSFAAEPFEHNLRSDSAAARIVFDSGIPIRLAPLEATRQVRLTPAHRARIGAAGPLGAALERDMRQWWDYWGETWGVPHDPLLVLAALDEDAFGWSVPGRVEIEVGGDQDGASRFVPDPTGATVLMERLDADRAAERIVDLVVAGCRPGGLPHAQGGHDLR
ncbi:hypothetical protein GCM10027058_18460 [Microbacterium neimengense]